MGDEFLRTNLHRILSLTRFHVLGSQSAMEASRLCLAESQRKIMLSQQVIAKSDTLIRALRSELESSVEQEPAR